MLWDEEYKKYGCLFGLEPNLLIKKFLNQIRNGKVLDLGCGECKDLIFLAKNGFEVYGVDNSKEAVKKAMVLAKKDKVKLNIEFADIKNFNIIKNTYSLVISFNVLHFLKKEDVNRIINQIKQGLVKDGMAIISVFTQKDPSHLTNSGYYFGKNELLQYFNDFKVLYYKENKFIDEGHGNMLKHYHCIASIIAKK